MYTKTKLFIGALLTHSLLFMNNVFAEPKVNCIGLPGCNMTDSTSTDSENGFSSEVGLNWISSVIGETIQYVAVMAVISLMLAGIFYILSGGEEEKTKKAKTWIIWSLVGVILSISAMAIIRIVNNFQVN